LASGSGRFIPRVERAGGFGNPNEYAASGSMEQAKFWMKNASQKLINMEVTIKEAARLLSSGPSSILKVLKEKVTS
jgi:hypothetical protein